MADMEKVQWRFPVAMLQRVEELREEFGLKDSKEVMMHAVKFLDWFADNRKNGWALMLSKDERLKEVEVLL